MKKSGLLLFTACIVVIFLSGCATSIPVVVQRPAELDLNGAKSIAVLPITTSSEAGSANINQIGTIIINIAQLFSQKPINQDEHSCADYMTTSLSDKLSNSAYFSLISAVAVEKALANGQKSPSDVYFTGKIYDFKNEIIHEVRKIKKDGVESTVDEYARKVTLTVTYQIINSSTNVIISSKTETLTNTSGLIQKQQELPSALFVIKSKIDSLSDKVMRQLQPYTITKNITLVSDKTKDPAMQEANKFAKGGSIVRAKEMFLECYTNSNYFEAGYNAAMLMQVTGDLSNARDLMQKLVREFGDVRSSRALNDINNEIALARKLQAQNNVNHN